MDWLQGRGSITKSTNQTSQSHSVFSNAKRNSCFCNSRLTKAYNSKYRQMDSDAHFLRYEKSAFAPSSAR